MKKCVKYKCIETITYTDGTPPLVGELEGTRLVMDDLPVGPVSKTELLRWVEERLNPESRISGLLFRHRKDAKQKRSRYAGVKFEVTDAWIVEYPDTPAPSA
jgi:hypothetical protein